MSDPDRITVTAHPPERGRVRSLVPAQAGASCCCCCCCLHSVGALVGAAVAPVMRDRQRPRTQEEEDYADAPDAGRPGGGPFAVRVFWLSTLILGVLVLAGGGVLAITNQPGDFVNGVLVAGFAIIMLLPALLLVAAAVAAVVIGLSGQPDKARELGQLGRITAGSLIGALVGTVPMACLLFALMRS